jgi:hypothetical protein
LKPLVQSSTPPSPSCMPWGCQRPAHEAALFTPRREARRLFPDGDSRAQQGAPLRTATPWA